MTKMAKIILPVPPERSRTYIFDNYKRFTVWNVTGIHVSESGTHYINHGEGGKLKTIVRCGWIAIELDADTWEYPKELNQE